MASTRYPQRVRNDLRFRELTVLRVERVSAGFQRIVLGGEALEGFSSRGFDDHTKVFFPAPGTTFVPPVVTDEGIDWGDGVRPQARDYTPLYDEAVMSWCSISSFMTAALPAAGRLRRKRETR
jgi:ferric-chelate reductase (NADPH)